MLISGIGANVVNGKLSTAIRIWKNELADSGKIEVLKMKKDGYIKPSTKRRDVLLYAKKYKRPVT